MRLNVKEDTDAILMHFTDILRIAKRPYMQYFNGAMPAVRDGRELVYLNFGYESKHPKYEIIDVTNMDSIDMMKKILEVFDET